MRFMKTLAAGLALTIGATSLVGTAEARHRNRHGDAVAAGILGFAAGAILSGALARPRYYEYYERAPVYRAPPPPVIYRATPVYYAPAAWTPEWYAYCARKYQSFDAGSGTFLGYDGYRHVCI